VVLLAQEPGQFVKHRVRLGHGSGDGRLIRRQPHQARPHHAMEANEAVDPCSSYQSLTFVA
jgi:hypothetical protein